jgi:hypothetical protein
MDIDVNASFTSTSMGFKHKVMLCKAMDMQDYLNTDTDTDKYIYLHIDVNVYTPPNTLSISAWADSPTSLWT